MKARHLSLVGGLLALGVTLVANLSEKGILAIQPPFDSGFRSTVEEKELRLRCNAGMINAALDLLVDVDDPAGLEAGLVDGDREASPLGVRVSREEPHTRVRAFRPGGDGLSDKFEWPSGIAVALRSPGGAPRLVGWTLHSDQHPTDSSDAVAERRKYRGWLLGSLVGGVIAGAWGLWAGYRKETEGGAPGDLKIFVVEQVLLKLESKKQPEVARLGQAILRSMLLENMSRGDAIARHARDLRAGQSAFIWARQVFLNTMTQMTRDLQTTYLSKLTRS